MKSRTQTRRDACLALIDRLRADMGRTPEMGEITDACFEEGIFSAAEASLWVRKQAEAFVRRWVNLRIQTTGLPWGAVFRIHSVDQDGQPAVGTFVKPIQGWLFDDYVRVYHRRKRQSDDLLDIANKIREDCKTRFHRDPADVPPPADEDVEAAE